MSHNDLTRLAEGKMMLENIIESGHSHQDHIDIIRYDGPKRVVDNRVEAINGVIDLSRSVFSYKTIYARFKGDSKAVFAGSKFYYTNIIDESLEGSNFSRSEFLRSDLGRSVFTGSDFSYSKFHGTVFNDALFEDCSFRYVDFQFGEFVDIFYSSDWRGVDFTGTDLSWVDPKKVSEKKGFFDGCIGIDQGILDRIKATWVRKRLF